MKKERTHRSNQPKGRFAAIPKRHSRRRGKIAQLPKPLREEVNTLIHAHTSSSKIIAFLAERGHPGINAVNISDWVRGDGAGSSGFNDWLREREQLLALQARREFAAELVGQADGPQIHEATRLLAASQLGEVMIGFNVQRLKEALSARPVAFATLVTALRRLSRDSLAYQKYRRLVQEQKASIQQTLERVGTPTSLGTDCLRKMREAVDKL